jgi:hypothetical protein
MMAKTFVAQSVGRNHDWDFSVDEDGNITAFVVRSEVNYGTMGMTEQLDLWPLLDERQKAKLQRGYDQVAKAFNAYFLGYRRIT